jgi:hypothetical protein
MAAVIYPKPAFVNIKFQAVYGQISDSIGVTANFSFTKTNRPVVGAFLKVVYPV